MGKLLAPLALVLFASMTDQDRATITIDPDPPHAGKSATITYVPNASLLIEYTPGGIVRVKCGADGKADVVVPGSANAMLVTDANNPNISAGFSVTP
ncbi:MAG: hypothetical protein JNK15_23710 [Planctomycetes bacterium]|nr:hypothetical protein [Planctomycetota bacterium]